jgi:HK97 family phage prohead protease
MDRRSDLLGSRERRLLAAPLTEIRGATGSLVEVEGYASVFEAPYTLYAGSMLEFEETVARSAFDKTLASNPDVPLLLNHDGAPLARTKSGTLTLSTDDHGLLTRASLDTSDPEAKSLVVKMDRGDLDEMSFAFYTIRDKWSDDESKRRLEEVSIHKGDVSIVNYGANPATSVGVMRAIEALAEMPEDKRAEVLEQIRAAGLLETVRDAQRTLAAFTRGDAKTTSIKAARALIEGLAD